MTFMPFNIVDSTLREGEQFAGASFDTSQKRDIAQALDAFGVEYIEHTSPAASPQSAKDLTTLVQSNLRARIVTHVRCHRDDVRRALDCGVRYLNLVIGTSPQLRQHSHGKSIDAIIAMAEDVLPSLCSTDIEVRFSAEDSLRSEPCDLQRVYAAVRNLGVDRIGVADTVGIGTPRQIYDLVSSLTHLGVDIEFHGHNDTGCAVANAFAALEAGATHIDTCVLGIGERNGITPLGGLIARLYASNPAWVAKYRLDVLPQLDALVAECCHTEIPFNNYITGSAAFTHKAGIHTKAVLQQPETYEVLNPAVFGLNRRVMVGHKLTGWNAVRLRANQLQLQLPDETLKAVTAQIKSLADTTTVADEDVDALLLQAANPHPHAIFPRRQPHVANAR